MQIRTLGNNLKPLTLAAALLIGGDIPYADLDKYSDITSTITNHRTHKYLQETNNFIQDRELAKRRFESYYQIWRNKTFFLSSAHAIINQPKFKAIVNMGTAAVPFIVEKIESEPSLLVWALNLIYNDKISSNPKTTITDACKLWVKRLRG